MSFVLRCLMVLSLLAACGDDDDGTGPVDSGSPDVGADPCVTAPTCERCGCPTSNEYCDQGACVPKKAAGEACTSPDECMTRDCGVAESGTMACLVAPGDDCDETNCRSCDPYEIDTSIVMKCSATCTAPADCDEYCTGANGCFECIEGHCRTPCNATFDPCDPGYLCTDGACIPS